jgi:hypothetical protein
MLSSCSSDQNDKMKKGKSGIPKIVESKIDNDSSRAQVFYSRFYIQNKNINVRQKIDSIVYSFDSIQIKFWYLQGLHPSRNLFIVQNKNSKWAGFYYELEPEYKYVNGDSTREYLLGPMPMNVRKIKRVMPKNGWKKFIDSLFKLNIMTLPDMSQIPKMEITWTDSQSLIVEICTKDHFRFFHYAEPHRFEEKFWQADNMSRIQNLFYSELLE